MSLLAAEIGGFSYHGDDAPALRDVELTLRPGTLTAVLGGSGSGKTTLGKILAGWLRAGAAGSLRGSLALGGERLEFSGGDGDPRIDPAAWSGRVGYVPQDAATMLSTVRHTVAEELAFGLENRGVPRPEMLRRVALTAERTGLGGLLDRNPEWLSGGELRRLAVACAVIGEPEVLILDEPLASLDPAGAQGIVRLVGDLRASGTAVVVLGQAADGLARSAAHWLVLADGTAVAAGKPWDIPEQVLRDAGVLAGDAAGGVRHPAPVDPAAAPVLELRDVGFGYARVGTGPARSRRLMSRPRLWRERADDADILPLLRGLDLAVVPGEIVAVTGPNGAGKSTLLRLANGLLQPRQGDVRVLGDPIAGVPAGLVADTVGLLFQQPRDQLFERTVLREVRFGLRRLTGPDGDPTARAMDALTAVGLAGSAAAHPAELPSSRQRLLALATVLTRRPALLALDEPTVGLDRHGLARLHAAVADAAGRGAGVLLVTHDAAYARAAAHRVLELDGGRLRETWRRPAP
ncbi:ABC transporter ATP-binding protein [Arthrobacter sp. YD4]|uniref:ABC transporter ATP-binding protein n=1 Tax=Arthrobacter sp. YD4 TaxID=3058043 RepID=UPI0025B32141|nr:ABC transporter ATP-binding protein [Arthrobacter sp. YD4]MDN3937069.1 ABC transporter ATP-binding protein [Arthrobacter sp. YD4]